MRKFIIIFLILLAITPAWAVVPFDGTDDLLTCGTNDILQENQPLTISAWINSSTDHNGRVLSKRVVATGANVNFGPFNTTANSLRFQVLGSTNLTRNSSANVLVPGTWQHILVTWDGSTTASNVHIYVNGTEVSYATTTNGVGLLDNATGTICIGGNNGPTTVLNGSESTVAYWTAVLDSQVIANLAKSRVERIPLQYKTNLVAYWAMDEQPDGKSADGITFINLANPGTYNCTGDNGANNTGLTSAAEAVNTYQ